MLRTAIAWIRTRLGMDNEWDLPGGWPFLVAVPLLTFGLVNALLGYWGSADIHVARPFLADGNAEAAGRLRTIAAFLLFCVTGLAVFLYGIAAVLAVARRQRKHVAFAACLTLALGVGVAWKAKVLEGDLYLDRAFPCYSLSYLSWGRPLAPHAPDGKTEAPAPNRVNVSRLESICLKDAKPSFVNPLGLPSPGNNDRYRQLRWMFGISAIVFILALTAMTWGAICCLALPSVRHVKARKKAWEQQSTRLNVLLYLTGGFLVAGLLFSSSRFSWPAYSLHRADLPSFQSHVSALLLYLGVENSVLIAAFYLPVAYLLKDAARQRGGGVLSEAAVDPPAVDPLGAAKKAAAIFAPVLVAILTSFFKFS